MHNVSCCTWDMLHMVSAEPDFIHCLSIISLQKVDSLKIHNCDAANGDVAVCPGL